MTFAARMLGNSSPVSLPANGGMNVTSFNTTPTNAVAGFQFNIDGNIYRTGTNQSTVTFPTLLHRWLLEGAIGDYEVRVSEGGPDNWIGAGAGVWHSLSSSRNFYAQAVVSGIYECNGTFEIRYAGGATLATCTGGFAEATEDPG